MNIQKKVQKYINALEVKIRDDGTKFVCMKDLDKPEKLRKAIREAHGDSLPKDFIYSAFLELLEKISEYDSVKTIEQLEDVRYEIVDSCVDVYTKDLTEWLNSDIGNVYYLSDAMSEGVADDGFQLLTGAQYRAYDEVMDSVISLLSK